MQIKAVHGLIYKSQLHNQFLMSRKLVMQLSGLVSSQGSFLARQLMVNMMYPLVQTSPCSFYSRCSMKHAFRVILLIFWLPWLWCLLYMLWRYRWPCPWISVVHYWVLSNHPGLFCSKNFKLLSISYFFFLLFDHIPSMCLFCPWSTALLFMFLDQFKVKRWMPRLNTEWAMKLFYLAN